MEPAEPTGAVRRSYEQARLQLARLQVDEFTGLDAAFAQGTRLSARVLNVARVGIWLLTPDRAALRCRWLYEAPGPGTASIDLLRTVDYPTYIDALASNRWIAADDARTHPLTREFAAGYLDALGISSMLDAPIFGRGEVVGVVCHEQVGPPRHWTPDDCAFAGSVADMVASAFEQAARVEALEALQAAEAQLARAQKMEALGRLAAAVAHDVNNLLAVVSGSVTAAGWDQDPAGAPHARNVLDAVERGVGLMRRLLAFARPERGAPEPVDLGALVAGLEPILGVLTRGRCALRVDVAPAPRVLASRSQLEQVVLNLATNARDAMPGGGTLALAVRPRTVDGREHAALDVTDTGVGMSEEVLGHVFEPFFTTKPPDQGSGLGLPIVYGIVTGAGGTIEIESAPGAGTTVRVLLPAAPAAA